MGTVLAIGRGNTMETSCWSMKGNTTGMGTTIGIKVAAEAMLSVEVDCAQFNLIVTLGSVAPIFVRTMKLML